jgi:hypothetical protein
MVAASRPRARFVGAVLGGAEGGVGGGAGAAGGGIEFAGLAEGDGTAAHELDAAGDVGAGAVEADVLEEQDAVLPVRPGRCSGSRRAGRRCGSEARGSKAMPRASSTRAAALAMMVGATPGRMWMRAWRRSPSAPSQTAAVTTPGSRSISVPRAARSRGGRRGGSVSASIIELVPAVGRLERGEDGGLLGDRCRAATPVRGTLARPRWRGRRRARTRGRGSPRG